MTENRIGATLEVCFGWDVSDFSRMDFAVSSADDINPAAVTNDLLRKLRLSACMVKKFLSNL
jgi:hypothetical protein